MAGVFLCPQTCGFGKVIALQVAREVEKALPRESGESTTKYNARVKGEQYRKYRSYFPPQVTGDAFDIEFLKFHRKLPGLRNAMNKWNTRKAEEKSKFMETFSREKWQGLSENRRKEHSFQNCKACAIRYTEVMSYFPVTSNFFKGKAKQNIIFAANNEAQRLRNATPTVKARKRDATNVARALFEQYEESFQEQYQCSLASALSSVPGINLQHKTENDKRNERRRIYTSSKENVENQMKETAFLRCYGSGQSIRGWERGRRALSFEPANTARERMDEPNKKKRKKDHTGDMERMGWDKAGLKAEVEAYQGGHLINYSALARKYNVTDSSGQVALNGGQIVKEWLVRNGVDVDRFSTKRKNPMDPVIRRRKRRGQGGEISIPCEPDKKTLKAQLLQKIHTKEYSIGERIVPRKYEKLILTKDLKIKKVDVYTDGRKMPLANIRRTMLKKQEKFLRGTTEEGIAELTAEQLRTRLLQINEYVDGMAVPDMREKLKSHERTRHLMVWLDNSTVANSGYLVCLMTCLYDKAVFLTDEEYAAKYGRRVNVQMLVEEPELHFIAKCGSSDHELLLYSETRLQCVRELCDDNSISYTDIMRFCQGDSPLRAFETGQQKGGNYFCSTCEVHCDMTSDLAYTLNLEAISLTERQQAILRGTVSLSKSKQKKAKPLEGLKKEELEKELASRGIYEGKTKMEMQKLLTEEMKGKQRVPALLFNTPTESLTNLNLESYEVIPCEPLHDLGNHIANFFAEFPSHLMGEEKALIEETITLSLAGKDSKRCVDQREALIKTAGVAHQSNIMSKKAMAAIDTLVEMQRLLYAADSQRSPASILRYSNQAWYHAILLIDFVKDTKKLTSRKLYGVYFHNLTAHATSTLRLMSGQAANAERQERIFNSIKRITKQTSNYHQGQIIPNLFIRLQAERQIGLQRDDVFRQQDHVSKLATCLPSPKNTVIPEELIQRHSHAWQAHLQEISDFLVEGEGVWWKKVEDGVEFHDVTDIPSGCGPSLHHFRSSNLKKEAERLDNCWKHCIANSIPLPTHLLRIDQDDGTTLRIRIDPESVPADTRNASDETSEEDENAVSITLAPDEVVCHNAGFPLPEEVPPVPLIATADIMDATESEDENVVGITLARDEVVCIDPDLPPPKEKHANEGNSTTSLPTSLTPEPATRTTDSSTELTSRLGKALEIVVGKTTEVSALDKKHARLRIYSLTLLHGKSSFCLTTTSLLLHPSS
ncbi:uncharacterized protein LOC125563042 [Nematostella vectensis]|uniref:uncharacterized protein LOC125563042 n=2 Tax=Nematostella vectensis TaxID=45351 RepID=UPI00207774FA|nr:uncharacterized protein LOC125563042 [Nematostella vectensis]